MLSEEPDSKLIIFPKETNYWKWMHCLWDLGRETITTSTPHGWLGWDGIHKHFPLQGITCYYYPFLTMFRPNRSQSGDWNSREVTIWSFARVVCRNVTLLDLIDLIDLLDLLGCREIDLISPTLKRCKKWCDWCCSRWPLIMRMTRLLASGDWLGQVELNMNHTRSWVQYSKRNTY